MNSSIKSFIKANAVELEPLVNADERFLWKDIRDEYTGPRLLRLRELGVLEKVDEETVQYDRGEITKYESRHVYQLCEQHRKVIADRLDKIDDSLPCGHPAHIKHKDDGGFGCKYCGEEQDYKRETIENAL